MENSTLNSKKPSPAENAGNALSSPSPQSGSQKKTKKGKKNRKGAPPPPPPPPPRGKPEPTLTNKLAEEKALQRSKAVEKMRRKNAGRKRGSNIPPPPLRDGSASEMEGPRSAVSPSGSPKSEGDTWATTSSSLHGGEIFGARKSFTPRGSFDASPGSSPISRAQRPQSHQTTQRHHHLLAHQRATTAPAHSEMLNHPTLDLGRMDETHVPPQLMFEPFSTTPATTISFQEWAPFVNDTTLKQLSVFNRLVEDLTLPSTMRTSTAMLQRALSVQTKLRRLCIVDTSATEPQDDLDMRELSFWRIAGFNSTGPLVPSVRQLILAGNASWVDDEALAIIGAVFPGLAHLDVAGCHRVSDVGISEVVRKCDRLQALVLNGCSQVTDYAFQLLCQAAGPRLIHVGASGTKISDGGVKRLLETAPKLTRLELRGCSFDPEVMRRMIERDVIYGARPTRGLPVLRFLDLAFCPQLHGLAIAWIAAGCTQLSAVSVRACPSLHNKGLSGFQGCRSLTTLDLARNPHFDDAGIGSLKGCASAPSLRRLDLGGCTGISDAALQALAGTFPCVRDLSLHSIKHLKGPGLLGFLVAPPRNLNLGNANLPDGRLAFAAATLTRLDLGGCKSLQPEALMDALRACEVLRDVNLSGVECVDDDVLAAIEYSLRAVRRLSLCGCPRISNFGLTLLPVANLTSLSLSNLPRIGADAVAAALEPMPSLQQLDLSGCTGLKASRLVGALLRVGRLFANNLGVESVGGVITSMHDLERARREFYNHHSAPPALASFGFNQREGTVPEVSSTVPTAAELTRSSMSVNSPFLTKNVGTGASTAAATLLEATRMDGESDALLQDNVGLLGLQSLNVMDCQDFAFAGERTALMQALDEFTSSLRGVLVHHLQVVRDDVDFVGLRTDPSDSTALRRHEYAHAFALACGCALTIQCFYRTTVARQKYMERYARRANMLHRACTVVQTAVRGMLAKKTVAKLRHDAALQAARDLEALRIMEAKFREQQAKKERRFLLTRTFGFLRLWTRARLQAKRLAKTALRLWAIWRVVNARYARRTLLQVLPAFRGACRAQRIRRQHLTKVFLSSIPGVEALNSSAQRHSQQLSLHFARRRFCKPALAVWRTEVLDVLHDKQRRAAMHCDRVALRKAYQAWGVWLAYHHQRQQHKHRQWGRAVAHHGRILSLKTLRELRRAAQWEREHRAVFEKLRGKFASRLVLRCFNTLVQQMLRRRRKHVADAHARSAHKRTTLRFLKLAADATRGRDRNFRSAVRLALHRTKKRCFRAMWKWVSRGRLLPLTIFKVKRAHVLGNHLALWKIFVEQDRARESANREQYLKDRAERKRILLELRRVENGAASIMQAIWRGAVDRKFAAFRRTFLEKYVTRIQALYRGAQGKLVKRKRERMKRLLDYKAREEDQIGMELADRESHQWRSFERAVTRLQANLRGKFSKLFAYRMKQKIVRQRAIDEREQRKLAIKRAEKKAESRADDSALRELMAVRIQCLYRSNKAASVYKQVIRHRELVKCGTRIQTWYRFRQANKDRARKIRLLNMKVEMNKRRRATASLLRGSGLRTRKVQNEARRQLTKFGLYPDTFCGDPQSLRQSLVDDWHELLRHARSSFRYFMHLRHKMAWARDFEVPTENDELTLQQEEWQPAISRYDSVQVVSMEHARFGETGFVLGFVGDGGYGTKAAVKMDSDGVQVFTPLWQAIKGVGLRPTLVRVATPVWRRFTQADIDPCRTKLLLYAQKAAVHLRAYRAARRVQKIIRMRHARIAISETRRLYYRAIQLRRQQVYRVLARLHLATAANGRLLVKLRVLKPEDMPHLPESIDFDFAGYRRKVERSLQMEIKDLFEEKRGMLYRQVKAGKIAKDDVLRWRERTPAALAMTKFTSWVQKHVLFKVAEKLIIDGDTLDLDNDEDERSRFLHGLARAVGGADFFYDVDERNAWAGLHFLEELRHSPHVTHNPLFPVSGHCIVHGVWAGNVPHGDGMAWFPVGRDPQEIIFARQKASFKDADREWPLYDEIQGVFDQGRLRTDVKTHIRFRTGDRYVGFFVPFGGKARGDHRGTWYKHNGWVYKGTSVTNHFNFKQIQGYFRVVTPKGGRYTGHIYNNKRHGFGYMKFGVGDDAAQYRGEWRIGLRHGFGTFVSKEGDVYTGEWVNDKKHGRGVEKLADGVTIYEGNFVDGRWHGDGVLRRPSKYFPGQVDRIEAQFEYGHIHGNGKLYFPNGDRFEGTFEKSMRAGQGKVFFTTSERFEGNFEADEMHGRGVWSKPRGGGFDEKRVGIWDKGNHQRWLGYAVSKLVTTEFCDRFRADNPDSFKGMYAQFVAEKIPDLPTGVDGTDERVSEILSKIMLEQGPLAQKLMLQKTQAEFDFHQPVANAASEKLTEAKMRIEECKDNLDIASRRVRQSKALLKKLRDTRETFDKELDTFWSTDEHRLQERYERSVSLLEELDREDWYKLRAIPSPPPPIEMTLQSCLAIFGILDVSWEEVKLLCNDNIVNMRYDDKDAFINTYDNKFVFETKRLDIYAVAKRPVTSETMKSIERVFYHPDVLPNNPEVYETSLAASRVVGWFRRFFLYMRKAREVLDVYDKVVKVKHDLDEEIDRSYELEDKLKDAETELREAQTLLEITEAVHTTVMDKKNYLQGCLDSLHRTIIDLTGNTLVRDMASSTLEDALQTRELSTDDVFTKARANDVDAIHAILEADFDVGTQDENGNTLLHVAAQQVDIELCKLLVEKYSAPLDVQNKTGNTALHYALHYGAETELGPYLIEKGASDTIDNALGLTPYDGAGASERKALREATGDATAGLLKSDDEGEDSEQDQEATNTNSQSSARGSNELKVDEEESKTQTGNVTAGESKGAVVAVEFDKMPITDKESAFGAAGSADAGSLTRMLDDRFVNCSVTDVDEDGNTYLLAAAKAMQGQDNVFKYQGLMLSLLKRKSDVNHVNVQGNTALHFAYQYDESGSVAAFLIENGADDTVVNHAGLTCYDGVDTLREPGASGGNDAFW